VVLAVVISGATGLKHMMVTRTTVMFQRDHMFPVIRTLDRIHMSMGRIELPNRLILIMMMLIT
jgi:hypothetical protein